MSPLALPCKRMCLCSFIRWLSIVGDYSLWLFISFNVQLYLRCPPFFCQRFAKVRGVCTPSTTTHRSVKKGLSCSAWSCKLNVLELTRRGNHLLFILLITRQIQYTWIWGVGEGDSKTWSAFSVSLFSQNCNFLEGEASFHSYTVLWSLGKEQWTQSLLELATFLPSFIFKVKGRLERCQESRSVPLATGSN